MLGYPLHTDGSECLTTTQVRNFAASLRRRVTLPIYYMNEVLSSADAESRLAEAGLKGRAIREVVDQGSGRPDTGILLSQPESLRIEA